MLPWQCQRAEPTPIIPFAVKFSANTRGDNHLLDGKAGTVKPKQVYNWPFGLSFRWDHCLSAFSFSVFEILIVTTADR